MKKLELDLETPINSEVLLKIIENLPYIEVLILHGKFSYFNLDSLFYLKNIDLIGSIMIDFNVNFFDNLCNQLEKIIICCTNFDDNYIEKLFYGRNFPYLTTFYILHSHVNIKLEKKIFDGFGMLQKLAIFENKHVRIADNDVFSNLLELKELHLYNNCIEFIDKTLFSNLIKLKILSLNNNQIGKIEENSFSNLHNLEYLDLRRNHLSSLSAKSFVGLNNLKVLNLRKNKLVYFDLENFDNIGKIEKINLEGNPIINEDEILNRSAQSNIIVYF